MSTKGTIVYMATGNWEIHLYHECLDDIIQIEVKNPILRVDSCGVVSHASKAERPRAEIARLRDAWPEPVRTSERLPDVDENGESVPLMIWWDGDVVLDVIYVDHDGLQSWVCHGIAQPSTDEVSHWLPMPPAPEEG